MALFAKDAGSEDVQEGPREADAKNVGEEEEEEEGLPVKEGDVVHCLLDLHQGELEFRVNGIWQPHRTLTGLPPPPANGGDDTSLSLWLVVSLCGQGDWISLYPSELSLRPSENLGPQSRGALEVSSRRDLRATTLPLGDGSMNPYDREREGLRQWLLQVLLNLRPYTLKH